MSSDGLWSRVNEQMAGGVCLRCGASMQCTHHPLCQASDGTPTALSDEEVRSLLALLGHGDLVEDAEEVSGEKSVE